jgi:hypothetical protein
MQFTDMADNDEKYVEGVYSRYFHVTFNELLEELEKLLGEVQGGDRKLLEHLREFYFGSRIYQVAGTELSNIRRARIEAPENSSVATSVMPQHPIEASVVLPGKIRG